MIICVLSLKERPFLCLLTSWYWGLAPWNKLFPEPFPFWSWGRAPTERGRRAFPPLLWLTWEDSHPVCLGKWLAALSTQKHSWTDKSNLLVLFKASGLSGKWRGGQRLKCLSYLSAPLLLFCSQQICDQKQWSWGLRQLISKRTTWL